MKDYFLLKELNKTLFQLFSQCYILQRTETNEQIKAEITEISAFVVRKMKIIETHIGDNKNER